MMIQNPQGVFVGRIDLLTVSLTYIATFCEVIAYQPGLILERFFLFVPDSAVADGFDGI